VLEVKARNTRALALYARNGFVEVGRRRAFYADGSDAVLMARPGAPAHP
jgi:ribosomal-protein-alanine N-acetyltransferase